MQSWFWNIVTWMVRSSFCFKVIYKSCIYCSQFLPFWCQLKTWTGVAASRWTLCDLTDAASVASRSLRSKDVTYTRSFTTASTNTTVLTAARAAPVPLSWEVIWLLTPKSRNSNAQYVARHMSIRRRWPITSNACTWTSFRCRSCDHLTSSSPSSVFVIIFFS